MVTPATMTSSQPIPAPTTPVAPPPVTPVPLPLVQAPQPTQQQIAIAIVSNIPVRVTSTTMTPSTPAPAPAPVTQPKPPPPAPKPIVRYAYRNPGKPKPGNHAESDKLFEQGMTAQKEKRLLDALALFRSASAADPANFQAQYNVAWTAYALKDWPAAVEAYEQSLAIEPDSATARYNFALALKQGGYPLDAANELERVLVKQPDDAAVHLSLANLYAQQLDSPRLARPHYLRVLELNPSHPQATQIRYWLSENTP
jgi:hypothetical protein